MDDTSGNEVSGLTITNTDTAESHASACGGVVFTPVAPPNNYTVDTGLGTDCVTTFTHNYDAVAATPEPLGAQTITVPRDDNFFLDQAYIGPGGVNIAAAPYIAGGPWTQTISVVDMATNGAGEMNLQSAGTAQYVDLADAQPNPDYIARFKCHADAGFEDTYRIYARYDNATDTGYFAQIDPTSTLTYGRRNAGVDTIFGTAPIVMPTLVQPAEFVVILARGTFIRALGPGGADMNTTDASITAPGVPAIHGTRAVGQPVLITSVQAILT